ncbi:MAG: hypothetical protein HFG28_08565 [Eubacterium sp.]|nr:hypothetical protein [Eubacterium sp.]
MNTKQLERKIKFQINKFFPELDLRQINFSEGIDSSPEGTYVFFKNDKFHVIFTEKGKIRMHEEYNIIDDVLWEVLEIVLFDMAMDYALKNREQGKDFRRLLFNQEIELFGKFGAEFKNKKVNEIKNILKESPYNDDIV